MSIESPRRLPAQTVPAPAAERQVPVERALAKRPAPEPLTVRHEPRQLSVVHVVTGLMLGGAERQVEHLLRWGRMRSRVVTVYEDGPVADELRRMGFEVQRLCRTLVSRSSPTKPLRDSRIAAICRLAIKLRRIKPDVVHVHLLTGQAIGIPAARLAGVPVVLSSEHSIMDDEIEGRPATRMIRTVYRILERLASHTVAVSPAAGKRLTRWGIAPERISVVENGIDMRSMHFDSGARSAVRAELGLEPNELVIGAVGRLAPVKRFVQLVTAVAPLLRTGQRRLVIVGAGPLRDELLRTAENLGVADRVLLTGARPDVARIFNAFDVFASPSRDETFGMAVVEALANGLPTVYSQCPAIEDIDLDDIEVDDDRLIKVSRELDRDGEVIALRAAILALSEHQGRRRCAPEALNLRYATENRVNEIEVLYAKLLERHEHAHRRWRSARKPEPDPTRRLVAPEFDSHHDQEPARRPGSGEDLEPEFTGSTLTV